MTEQLIDFETAKLAREKGFVEECRSCWEIDDPPKESHPPKDEHTIAHFMVG